MASRLPGNLSVLPLELVWEILDQLFFEHRSMFDENYMITHDEICSISQLMLTHKDMAAVVESHLSRGGSNSALQKIRTAIQDDARCTYNKDQTHRVMDDGGIIDHEAAPIIGEYLPGLVTTVVMRDCPRCFMLLRKLMPELELDGTWVNRNGTGFFAIAVHCSSLNIVKYFCSIESSNGSCIPLLVCPSNRSSLASPLPLQILGRWQTGGKHDVKFIRELFAFLMPRLHELSPGLTPDERIQLCRFLTVEQAIEFEKAGMPLYTESNNESGQTNCYHAAVYNGPEFLEYIRQKTSLSMVQEDSRGMRPIDLAVFINRLDCAVWLQAHGGGDTIPSRRRRRH